MRIFFLPITGSMVGVGVGVGAGDGAVTDAADCDEAVDF